MRASSLVILLFALLTVTIAAAQVPLAPSATPPAAAGTAKPGAPASPDYSKEGIVLEQYVTKVAFKADGTDSREVTAAIRVQAESGVQALAVLRLPYTSENEAVDADYIRVRKPDGSVVVTPAYNIQDLPAEVTQVAPMYSHVHEKHITVKGLSVGDILEYRVRY